MVGVHFLGQSKVSVDEVDKPQPEGTHVVVKLHAAGICGTDRHHLLLDGQTPIPGHENSGEVVAVDKPSWLHVGDRVAINCHITCGACEHCLRGDLYFCDQLTVPGEDIDGGFAEYLRIPESNCMSLPDDISYDQGALLVDVLGTAFRGIKRAGLIPGQQIAIWGAGLIGYEAALVAKTLGCRIAIFEMNLYRQAMAMRDLEPELVLDPTCPDAEKEILEWTNGRGIGVGFECVGSEKAAQQAIRLIEKRGKLAIIGVSHSLTLNPWTMIEKELSIFASRNFNTHEFYEMVALIRAGMQPEKVITHRFGIADAQKAFEVFLKGDCGKIVFSSKQQGY